MTPTSARPLRVLLALLALLALAFAGCTAKTDGTASASASGSLSGHAAATASSGTRSSATTATCAAPAGCGTAVVHKAFLTASAKNGTAPVNVTFALDATGADAKAAWTLAFGDKNQTTGTALPANVTHKYAMGGNLTARLTVRFADNSTANATVALTFTAGAAHLEKFDKTGTFTVNAQTAVGIQDCGTGQGAKSESSWVLAGTVTHFLITLTGDTTNQDSDLYLHDPAGKLVKASDGSSATEKIDVTGSFPAGTYKVTVLACTAVNAKWTVHGEATVTG
ncbi:MAG TPA: PKD domain-containing protein [Candidatus Thermoplasmatota archaeon]|nr:PKD domain-containing protein [Candidatus Thermoplasmatota archaeon]